MVVVKVDVKENGSHMRYIFTNLKRFDIPKEYDGINDIVPIEEWGSYLVEHIQGVMEEYEEQAEMAVFFPEAHLISAVKEKEPKSKWHVGAQGVYRKDTQKGGNFGAFTTNKTAKTLKALGCSYVLIGHCEERMDKSGVLEEAGVVDGMAVNRILNQEILCATAVGLKVLYCVGEKEDEQKKWKEVIGEQLEVGLKEVEKSQVVIAYEPLWAIGPGKPVPDKEYITKIAGFIKEKADGCPVVYGGGLKESNAEMLASIPVVDGGLIALTKFEGDIGFYPDGFERIVKKYLGGASK